jgi:zinc transporter ZupT
MLLYSALGALMLALVHFFTYKLRFSRIPRSKWLSAAGGVSVAYVFIHLLPELEEWQKTFEDKYNWSIDFLSHHLYLIALLGLTVFYGLERAAKLSKESERDTKSGEPLKAGNISVFWVHVVSFSIYNALIGYLLVHRDEDGLTSLAWFVLAMTFHFMVNDYGLIEHYQKKYLHKGRWVVSASIIGGWTLGALSDVSEVFVAILFAFVAGSVVLNVLKEELPEERKSNFWAFLGGAVLYSALLMAA